MGLRRGFIYTTGYSGQSFATNNTGSINLPATSSLNLSGQFTIEGWLYAMNTTSSLPFQKVGAQYQYQGAWGATGLSFYFSTDTGLKYRELAAPVGQWFYFAYVVDMANTKATLRINDTTTELTGITGTPYTTTNPGIISSGSSPWRGYMDEIRFWNVAKSQADLTENKNTILKGDEAGLVGYWKMDGNAANSCTTTGAANNGTVVGGGSFEKTIVAPLAY